MGFYSPYVDPIEEYSRHQGESTTQRMLGIRSECHILIFSLNLYKKNLDYKFRTICNLLQIIFQIYLPIVLSISQSYCAKMSRGTIFKTTQLPIRGGEVWPQERQRIDTLWIFTIQSLRMFTIQKDQHCVDIFQALSHWNALTLSLWEVTWSSRVNIFTSNIGHIEQII